MILKNACLYIFKLHRDDKNKEYKMEIILEPIKENIIFDISEKDFNRLNKKFHYLKGSETDTLITFRENILDETKIQYDLKQEYKKEFGKYYDF